MSEIITRFAPSPTGFLHIGGARTALFNYLFARHHGGKYLLRIEDTDQERSTDEAKHAIIEGLGWLGLGPDGEIVYQSQLAARHAEVAQQLLERGHAYKCYLSTEELDSLRQESRQNGQPIRSPWRERDGTDAGDAPYVIRLKAPQEDGITLEDAVQGTIDFPASALDDLVLLRADGTPTYMLAVVVDDYDMGVTHVIRGDDHLNNAARQSLIYHAMGWELPVYAHIPLIHGPDGAKLSKRHGALGVMEYEQMGYLPEALRNYLLRLGFSHGDDEIISDAQAIEWFALDALNKSAARFDYAKLDDVNGHYIRESDESHIAPLVTPFIETKLERSLNETEVSCLSQAIHALKERAKTLQQLADDAMFLFTRPTPADEKAKSQLADGVDALKKLAKDLNDHSEWRKDALMDRAKQFAEANDLKLGKVMAPVRVAITGSTASPSMFEVMEWLGKDESLARIQAAL